MAGGRPSNFTQEIADKLCAELAIGQSLRTVCSQDGMPEIRTVFNWLRTQDGFVQQYTRAKEESADALIEESLDIADDSSADFIERQENGKASILADHDHINRSRLRVDTRKWIASKMKPKKYGDASMVKHADPDGNPLKIQVTGVQPTPENT